MPEPTGPQSVLRNIRVAGSRRPRIQKSEDGFVILNKQRIRARVALPADAFLCRIGPANPDLVQLSIGRVRNRVANALFSPELDRAVVFEGEEVELRPGKSCYALSATGPLRLRVVDNLFKEKLGIKWFRPLDKSVFRRAPAGWCSWYYYYLDIVEEEVVKNTDWLASNLRRFGCEYVQIDDGWQGKGTGFGENRDWFVTCEKDFPHGMKWISQYIKSKGFKSGIWLIPFAQSDEKLYKEQPGLFVRKPDGTSPGELDKPLDYAWMPEESRKFEWAGRYFIDPTGREGQSYLHELFEMVCKEWDYDYVKIDGQGMMADFYEKWRPQLHNPSLPGDEAYRTGLAVIKSVMGEDRFLLNCGAGWASAGLCEGIRIGGDVGASWEGMQNAVDCTMRWLFLNHTAWWTDPDVVCVREPLTLEQARMWATLLGITGQLLMSSDKMYELPDERVELLRRIYPVADIRPMNLHPLEGRPGIFDLKVSKPDVGEWDIVAVFNWSATEPKRVSISTDELGLDTGDHVFYDVWRKELLSDGGTTVSIELPPAACRVLCIRRREARPQLIGVSRHITQGADDLVELRRKRTETRKGAKLVISGRSAVVGNDPYELRFRVPDGWVICGVASQGRKKSAAVRRDGSLVTVTIRRPRNEVVDWVAEFQRSRD